METVKTFTYFIGCFIFIGFLIPLIPLPLLRKFNQRGSTTRITGVLIVGLGYFFVSFGLYTWFYAVDTYIVNVIGLSTICTSDCSFCEGNPIPLELDGVTTELWIRNMVPPILRLNCYTNRDICNRTENAVIYASQIQPNSCPYPNNNNNQDFQNNNNNRDFQNYLGYYSIRIIMSVGSALTSIWVLWWFTRQKKT